MNVHTFFLQSLKNGAQQKNVLVERKKCHQPHKNRLIKGLITYAGQWHHIP
jgi:hypothetical protein